MPAALQVLTICRILSRLSKAVLAVVVIQAPRIALGSQAGVGGVGVPPPVVDFFLQPVVVSKQVSSKRAANRM